jgi:anti-sigma B factor antagonist
MQAVMNLPKATVMKLQGHLNAANATELKSQLTTAVSDSHSCAVLVDMKDVESLDSAGLMAFVSALSLSQQVGRRFSLCSVSPSIRIIFELTQLDRVFEIFESSTAFEVA